MAKATKNVKISQDSWDKYSKLRKRYDTPISHLLENLVENATSYDELDRLFGYNKKKKPVR